MVTSPATDPMALARQVEEPSTASEADDAMVAQIAVVTHSRLAPQGITQTTAPGADGTGF